MLLLLLRSLVTPSALDTAAVREFVGSGAADFATVGCDELGEPLLDGGGDQSSISVTSTYLDG